VQMSVGRSELRKTERDVATGFMLRWCEALHAQGFRVLGFKGLNFKEVGFGDLRRVPMQVFVLPFSLVVHTRVQD
jgi:hypothetical protein